MQTLELAKLLDKLGQEPAATDDTLSHKNAQDINSTMLHVMDLCRWALSLGDLDINKLIDCAEDRCRSGNAYGHTRHAAVHGLICHTLALFPARLSSIGNDTVWQSLIHSWKLKSDSCCMPDQACMCICSALGRGHTAVSSDESPNYTQISNKLSLSSDQQDKAVQLWQQVSCQMRG